MTIEVEASRQINKQTILEGHEEKKRFCRNISEIIECTRAED